MAKFFLSPIVTLNTLETMIEYMLISNILYIICEMTKKPLEHPKDDTKLDPLSIFAQNQNMGNKMEKGN